MEQESIGNIIVSIRGMKIHRGPDASSLSQGHLSFIWLNLELMGFNIAHLGLAQ